MADSITTLGSVKKKWRAVTFTKRKWVASSDRGMGPKPGEAGGYLVQARRFPFSAWLKPFNENRPDHPRGANEKIASDLACELGLWVPPVLLYRVPEDVTQPEHRCCVSLLAFDEMARFDVAEKALAGNELERFEKALQHGSGILAFDTWIDNCDRKNGGNTVVGEEPGHFIINYIDHSNAFNHGGRWSNERWQTVRAARQLPRQAKVFDQKIVMRMVNRIERLSASKITGIVDRIPDDYMDSEHRSVVVDGLLGRRSLVREAVEQHFRTN